MTRKNSPNQILIPLSNNKVCAYCAGSNLSRILSHDAPSPHEIPSSRTSLLIPRSTLSQWNSIPINPILPHKASSSFEAPSFRNLHLTIHPASWIPTLSKASTPRKTSLHSRNASKKHKPNQKIPPLREKVSPSSQSHEKYHPSPQYKKILRQHKTM